MKVTWCWRCGIDYPMLEDHEWDVIARAHTEHENGCDAAFNELKRQAVELGLPSPNIPTESTTAMARQLWHMIAGFEMFTGILEDSPNPIWHHRLSAYGPTCTGCGKLLRTKRATYCAFCGLPATPHEKAEPKWCTRALKNVFTSGRLSVRAA